MLNGRGGAGDSGNSLIHRSTFNIQHSTFVSCEDSDPGRRLRYATRNHRARPAEADDSDQRPAVPRTRDRLLRPTRTVGNADVDGDRVIRFDKRAPELPYIDAGFSLMPSSVIDLLPPSGPCSFEESIFPLLAAERRLACEIVDLNFFDIGTPEELARTNRELVD